jgi:hypothetical protein
MGATPPAKAIAFQKSRVTRAARFHRDCFFLCFFHIADLESTCARARAMPEVTSTAKHLKGKVIKTDAVFLCRTDKRSKSLTIATNNGLERSDEEDQCQW